MTENNSRFWSVLLFFLVVTILPMSTFIHELGHYLVCKIAGISVMEFVVGSKADPLLIFNFFETEVNFSFLAFSGYVLWEQSHNTSPWLFMVIDSMGIIFCCYYLWFVGFVLLKVLNVQISFIGYIARIHVFVLKFAFYFLIPFLGVREMFKGSNSLSKLMYHLFKRKSILCFLAVLSILNGLSQQFANLWPGVTSATSDGTHLFTIGANLLGASASLEQTALVGMSLFMAWEFYFLLTTIPTFIYYIIREIKKAS